MVSRNFCEIIDFAKHKIKIIQKFHDFTKYALTLIPNFTGEIMFICRHYKFCITITVGKKCPNFARDQKLKPF